MNAAPSVCTAGTMGAPFLPTFAATCVGPAGFVAPFAEAAPAVAAVAAVFVADAGDFAAAVVELIVFTPGIGFVAVAPGFVAVAAGFVVVAAAVVFAVVVAVFDGVVAAGFVVAVVAFVVGVVAFVVPAAVFAVVAVAFAVAVVVAVAFAVVVVVAGFALAVVVAVAAGGPSATVVATTFVVLEPPACVLRNDQPGVLAAEAASDCFAGVVSVFVDARFGRIGFAAGAAFTGLAVGVATAFGPDVTTGRAALDFDIRSAVVGMGFAAVGAFVGAGIDFAAVAGFFGAARLASTVIP